MAYISVNPTSYTVTDKSQNTVNINYTTDVILTDIKLSTNNGSTYKDKISMTQTNATFDITGMNNNNYTCCLKGFYEEAESGDGGTEGVFNCSITNNLTNCTNTNISTTIHSGSNYSATIVASSNYTISSISVTMGGMDITSSVVSGNNIYIENVSGNIVITATATQQQTGGGDNTQPPTSGSIVLNSTNHTINIGEMLTLSATINIDSSYAVFELRKDGTYLVSAYRSGSDIVCYTEGLNVGTYSNLTVVAKVMENSVYVDIAESQTFTLTVNSNSSSGGGSEGGGDSGGTNIYLEPSSLTFNSGTLHESKYFNVIGVSESDNVTFETNNSLVCSVRKLAYNRCEVIALKNGSTNVSATFGSNKLDCYVSISNMGSDSTVEDPISLPERIDTVAWHNQTFYISYSTNKEASTHYLDKNDGRGYVRVYPTNSYTNYSLQIDPITTTEPTHSWKLKVTDSRGNEAISTVAITVMGLPTDGGDTPPDNGNGTDSYNDSILSYMYPMPQSHECIPSGAPSDWKYQTRWENKDKPNGWSAFGGWAQIYRVDGTPFTQNTGVEMKNYKVFGWKNGQWHSVVELPYVTGNFYAEDFTDDANKYFSNGIKPSDDRSSVIIRLTSDMTISTSKGTKNVCYHPFTAQLDYDPNFEYIFTCVSMRKVKWDANGVDDMNTTRYCASCGGDWWRQKGLVWAPDWSNNKGIAQPKITEVTSDWKVFAMTTVPENWSNGFPTGV